MIYIKFDTNELMDCMFPAMMDELSNEVIYNLYQSMSWNEDFLIKYKGYRFIHRFCWKELSDSDLYGIEIVFRDNENKEICQKFWMNDCDWMCGSHYKTRERIEFNWNKWIKRVMDKLRNDGKLKKEVFEKDEYYVEVGEVFRDETFE